MHSSICLKSNTVKHFYTLDFLPLVKGQNKYNDMDQITVEQLHNRLQNEKNLHVLDVREQDEFDENNIGARLWPLSKLNQMDTEEIEDWQDEEIIVHCRSGHRSIQACMLLETMGFSHVTNLQGGIKEWQEKYGSEKID